MVGGSGHFSVACIRKKARASSFYRWFRINEKTLIYCCIVQCSIQSKV